MQEERRNFLGMLFAGAAAVAARSVPSLAGEKTTKISTDIILPESLANSTGGEPLLVTSLQDPRAQQFTQGGPLNNSIHDCVWFGMAYGKIQRLSDTEYSQWLKGHMDVNRSFGGYDDLSEPRKIYRD